MSNKNIKQANFIVFRNSFLFASILLLVSIASFADEQANITIKTADFSFQEQTFLLNADIQYTLSDEAIEALHNGVTLTFNVDLSIIETRPWLWDKHHNTISLPYQIKRHTLAETYQVSDINHHIQHSFSSLNTALRVLGTLRQLPMHAIEIPDGYNAYASIAVYLNIEALPLPMRPMAYLTPGWHLRSDPFQWSLNP
ncbi:MAG: hypothetical protein A6F72_08125 [Cycloclasticus sp. symbiont of Poecilosclerida sp. N]|nr:MAG: hypothetical protein A6F72_08125 [Cycloclasticus sp. symbiont of Poecilosclerida sp. N]